MAVFLPRTEDITIYRGDDVKIAFTLTDNGDPRDLEDWDTFEMNVRRITDQAPVLTNITITNNNSAVTGQLIANIDATDLAETNVNTVGEYELKGTYTNPSDSTDVRIQTFAIGAFSVTDDVA